MEFLCWLSPRWSRALGLVLLVAVLPSAAFARVVSRDGVRWTLPDAPVIGANVTIHAEYDNGSQTPNAYELYRKSPPLPSPAPPPVEIFVTGRGGIGTIVVEGGFTPDAAGDWTLILKENGIPKSTVTLNLPPKTPQTITFNIVAEQLVGHSIALEATSDSGLPVNLTTNPNRAIISEDGKSITFNCVGDVDVHAFQAGNSIYDVASTVTRTFHVSLASPSVSAPWVSQNPATALANGSELVATLPGDITVDNKGSANYSIPLSLPPGRAGLAPKVSVNYSSGGGNGPLGQSFSLSTGFPQAISRGRSILARETVTRGVTFTANDKFYLDGKLLICTSTQAYGSPNSTYRTEVDSFATIVALADPANTSVIGSFVVTDKSGTKMTFGKLGTDTDGFHAGILHSTGALDALAYEWALKRVEDTVGNKVDLTYHYAGAGEYLLGKIEYTGNTSGTPLAAARVRFLYNQNSVTGNPAGETSRRDATTRYVATRSFAQRGRLDQIVSEIGIDSGTAVRFSQYDLTYEYGPDGGPSRINAIAAAFRDPSADLMHPVRPTLFHWEQSTWKSTTINNPLPAGADTLNPRYSYVDVDGDGRDDYVDFHAPGVIKVALSTGSGFGPLTTWCSTSLLTSGEPPLFKMCDINGDGLKDIVFMDALPYTNAKLYAFKSNGAAFVGLNGGAAPTAIYTFVDEFRDPDASHGWNFLPMEKQAFANRICTADFSGDGRDDILIHRYDGNLQVLQSTGGGFAVQPLRNVGARPMAGLPIWQLCALTFLGYEVTQDFSVTQMPCDLNGDGIMDYVWVETTQKLWDFTEGGRAGTKNRGSKTVCAITSQPDGGFSQVTEVTSGAWSSSNEFMGTHRANTFAVMLGDVNGDGLTDIMVMRPADQADASVYNNGLWRGLPQCLLRMETFVSMGASGKAAFDSYDLFAGQLDSSDKIDLNGTKVYPWFDKIKIGEWSGSKYYDPSALDATRRPTLLACGITSSADNMTMTDVNGDGKVDYVWYSDTEGSTRWWVMYSQGDRLAAPVPVPLGWQPTQEVSGSGAFNVTTRSEIDLNGDGEKDYSYYNGSYSAMPGVTGLHLSQGHHSHRIDQITDGFDRTTVIAYKPITDASVYTPGAAVSYPIRELRNATYVVSDLWKDVGAAGHTVSAQVSYQYSGNRLDLSGRGTLGFHSFVTLDRQTNVFKYQFLAQSFPMTGLTAREQTYRYWPSTDGNNVNFRLIDSHDNTVVFDEVVNPANSSAWGTVFPFISQAIEYRWENSNVAHFTYSKSGSAESKSEALFTERRPGVGSGANKDEKPHIVVSAQSYFDNQTAVQTAMPQPQAGTASAAAPAYQANDRSADWSADQVGANTLAGSSNYASFHALFEQAGYRKITYGNLRKLTTDNGDNFTETVTTDYKAATTVTVGSASFPTLAGLPETVTTSVRSADYGSESAPVKRFTYWKKGSAQTPLVETETVDATDNTLDTTTTYFRDNLGRVTETQLSGYVDSTTPDTSVTYTVSKVTRFNPRFDLPEVVEDAYGHAKTTVYHDYFGIPQSVQDVNLAKIESDFDALGRPTESRDLNLAARTTSTFVFTSDTATDWTKTLTISPPNGVEGLSVAFAYAVRKTATSSAVSGTSLQPAVTAYFDRLGRTIRTVKEGFTGQTAVTDTIYNSLGQVVAVSLPYNPSDTATGPFWTKTTYDLLGRVQKVVAPNGTETISTYAGRATRVSVDPPLLGGVNPAAQSNTTLVDAKGRTIKVWNADNQPADLGAASLTAKTPSVEYKLDGFGRMRSTVLLGNTAGTFLTVTAKYDALGGRTELNDPDKGLWQYTNNALGQVLRQEDARHNVTVATFDRLGRPLTRTTAEPSSGTVETASWFYYDTAAIIAARPAAHLVPVGTQGWIGAPQREESSTAGAPGYAFANPNLGKTVTLHYYDPHGRPAINLTSIDEKWFYTCTDYDAAGRVGSVRHFWKPVGHEAPVDQPYVWQDFGYSYTYNAASYLLELRDATGQVWWEADTAAGYDHLDRPVLVRKGHGHWTKRSYRPEDGTLTDIKTGPTAGSATVQALRFYFDGFGNLVTRADDLRGLSESFGYDSLNRMTKRNGVEIAKYSDNGNILSKTDVTGSGSGDYAYSQTKPHAVTSAFGYTMTYDDNGNLLTRINGASGETWSTRWAGFDKPRWLAKTAGAATSGSEFVYNAARSRVLQTEFDSMAAAVPDRYTRKRIYAWGATGEIDYRNLAAAGAAANWQLDTIRLYVPGPDGVIGAMEFAPNGPVEKSKRPLVYHYDHLGSLDTVTFLGDTTVHVATDDNGKPARHSFDPWGQRRNADTWSGIPVATTTGGHADVSPRGFTGHEMMDNLGLVNMNGRIYDGLLGRFLSADLLVNNPSDLQSFNRYSYVRNNPLTLTDPSGFAESDQERKEREAREEQARQARSRANADVIAARGLGSFALGLGGAPATAADAAVTDSAERAQPAATPTTTNSPGVVATGDRGEVNGTEAPAAQGNEEKKDQPKGQNSRNNPDAGAAGVEGKDWFPVTAGGKEIGVIAIGDYSARRFTRDGRMVVGAHITAVAAMIDGGVYQWRQHVTEVDDKGRFFKWRDGRLADNLLDNGGEPWEWYHTPEQREAALIDGYYTFNDSPSVGASDAFRPGTNQVTMSFDLELVRVGNVSDFSGGTTVFRLNWGYSWGDQPLRVIPLQVLSP